MEIKFEWKADHNPRNQLITIQETMQGGGQTRTIICPCGKTIKGSVREVNMKFKMHQKVCNDASDKNLPAFNREAGNYNGVHGMSLSRNGNPQVQHDLHSSIITDETIMGLIERQLLNQIQEERQK